MSTKAYAARSSSSPLAPFTIERRSLGPSDVEITILHCGVCHSDLHQARNEWSNTIYPCVPGHEIVGRVAHVGKDVTRFAEGDLAAVGCMVDSCRKCASCERGLEQYCVELPTFTYNGRDERGSGPTFGGYAQSIVVDEAFTLRLPSDASLAATAPLLCAGITTYSPLRHWNVGPGTQVGVVGLGGLGHMGVKLARALGAHVVLLTTSPRKVEDGLRLGAHEVVVSTDANAMAKHRGRLDFVLDTVSAAHDVDALLSLLRLDGTLALVGAPDRPLSVAPFGIMLPRRQLAGSGIGGIAETQEMLDFCATHGITADVETIAIQQINEAYERLLRGDVRYRFVIDMASLA
ncbi:NAD(P)-dependent alcohol dehydrogenase [Sandaracinus amylolyticus]|uniref:NAD(P)-dependent alcohol dehydrogenase n=1 Tax=Sandaracinus amylolyticus TaxID=927083 RepID=UPI001F1DA9B9|nr:NAD(P)-dependent alcohol dehydrogenase [Sandaracinus amylolyticus]UJR85263.1 Hypothetical protein I5071_73430 [Sandaracinus amylolyticus]